MQSVKEWFDVDAGIFFNEIVPLYRPAILRGFAADWPAVAAGKVSPQSMVNYLNEMDKGATGETFIGRPEIQGKFFFRSDMKGFNFERTKEPLSASLSRILSHLESKLPPSIYTGSVPIGQTMPDFVKQNRFKLVDKPIQPRIWVGNAGTVQAHFDQSDNVACVVAGKRRFTLFPPDQIANMYVSPLENTVAGPQLSMVNIESPDFEKHPRFQQALDVAMVAELGPGDAIYIPSLWWHHVQALDKFNVLVNYWWSTQFGPDSPMATLIHGLLTLRNLSEGEKKAWRGIFDHYIFHTSGDPVAHLAPEHRGVLGRLTSKSYQYIKSYWVRMIKSQM